MDKNTKIYVNPTGRFVVGGPHGDAGVTGRKIIVDTYGGYAPHGGGAFSGKDPTKVDRSACYMARYVAKNVVAAGLADRATVQLAYAIGVAEPVSVMVDTDGSGKIPEPKITELVRQNFKLTPRGIHRRAQPAASDLREDGGVRPLRPHRTRVHVGEDRQGRGAQEGRRPLTGRLEAVPHGDGGPAGHRRRFCLRVTLPPKHTVLTPVLRRTARSRASSTSIRRGPTAAARSTTSPTPPPRAGLKFIVVTDHGDATRAPDPPVYRDGVLCLDAVEISTAGGHYIALDMPKAPYPLGGRGPRCR